MRHGTLSAEALVEEVEPLTHAQRVRRLVDLGRRAATDPDTAAMIARLEAGDVYRRWLALLTCYTSRDAAHVLRALGDPSRLVRGLANSLVPLVCDDEQAAQALLALHPRERTRLVRRLYTARRQAAIDRALERLSLAADRDFLRLSLLPFGSELLASRWLHPDSPLLAELSVADWRRLTRHHPAMTRVVLERALARADEVDARLEWIASGVVAELVEHDPAAALELVQHLLERDVAPSRLPLQRLAERRPVEMADLILGSQAAVAAAPVRSRVTGLPIGLRQAPPRVRRALMARLAPSGRPGVRFTHRVRQLRDEQLVQLVRAYPDTLGHWQLWLRRLPAARRATLSAAVGRGWRDATDGSLPHGLVALLPAPLREAEGRRHLDLPALAARPAERLAYAAFLPWDETRQTLDPFIRNPDATLRSAALSTLVFAARFERQHLGEVLDVLHARRNEQDPVRLSMLRAVAALPPGAWRAEHLAGLGALVRDALDAADLSPATGGAAEALVLRVLPGHPAWAAEWLATLMRERGYVTGQQLVDKRLSDAQTRALAAVLLPVLRTWQTRERESSLLAFARGLGRRLRVFDGLVEVLEDVLRTTRAAGTADTILTLLADHRRDRLAALVPALLADDPTWERRPVVYTYLHRQRQDLLAPHLGQHAYAGRFATGNTRFVLPVLDGFWRWTPHQQQRFAATLRTITGEATRDTPSLFQVIQQLAAMPAVEPQRLAQLASLSTSKAAVRDAALRALARLDAGQGMPLLLEALEDERARIAIYALRQAILPMPAHRALELLRGVPRARITVAKEIVRLIGELHTPDAYAELLAWHQQDLHRDVRVALLRALWDYPEQTQTWSILHDAARSADAAIAAGVVRVPAERLSQTAQRQLVELLALLLGHAEPAIRLATLQRCATLPVADPLRTLLQPLLAGLESDIADEVQAAARAVFATYAGRDAPLLAEATRRVLPQRRSLVALVTALESGVAWNRRPLLPSARAVLEVLSTDLLTATLQARLAMVVLPADEVQAVLARLATAGGLHPDALVAAMAAGHSLARRDDEQAAGLEAALASSGDDRLRRLGLALVVAQAGTARGWDDHLLDRLHAYRADPSPLVAAAAHFTFPPPEPPSAA